jgi:hypothetical protein
VKMRFASTAVACIIALGPITSQRAEAAPAVPVAMVKTASTPLLAVGGWRGPKPRNIWPLWHHHHRYRENDFDRRYDGYLSDGYQRDYASRSARHDVYSALRDYSVRQGC